MRQSCPGRIVRKWAQDAPGHRSLTSTQETALDLCCLSVCQQPAGPQRAFKTPVLRRTGGRGKEQGCEKLGHRPAQSSESSILSAEAKCVTVCFPKNSFLHAKVACVCAYVCVNACKASLNPHIDQNYPSHIPTGFQ